MGSGAGGTVDGVVVTTRPVALTRELGVFRLAFAFDPALVERVRRLPFARFDPETRTWTCQVCAQAVEELRRWYHDGLCDVPVDTLLAPGERPAPVRDAVLRPGTVRRPFVVVPARRDDRLFARLRAVPGAGWDRGVGGMSFPPSAAAALGELVERGVLDDPERLLGAAEVVVAFDARNGAFKVTGDPRAARALATRFPERDVVGIWLERGLDVAFADAFSEEVYRSELVRAAGGQVQPAALVEPLYPYQAHNVAVALCRTGFGIFDAPGLGKTATAIGWGAELCARSEVTRVVVVTPGAVRTQWAREIARFCGLDEAAIAVVAGDKRQRDAAYAKARDAAWLIVHYDVLARDYPSIAPLVAGAALVADEVHRARNPQAKRTTALRRLAQRAARRLALSGTPVENDPGEWYSILSGFAIPGLFGTAADFLNRYCYPGRFGGFEGARNLDELRLRSAPHYLRHTKEQVAEHLPPLRVEALVLDPDTRYRALLARVHQEARAEIAAERIQRARPGLLDGELRDEIEAGAEMTAVGMLKLLCCSPRLLLESQAPAAIALCDAGLVPDEDGPKIDELRLRLAERAATGERVVVFCSSRRAIELISARLDEDGIRHVCFTGATDPAARDAAVAAFCAPPRAEDPGPLAFLATDAGAEGLNLGAYCSTLINVDVAWTPGRMIQRANRIHRVDQTDRRRRYEVINLVLGGSIEDGILRMLDHKADLTDAIFGERGSRAQTTGRRRRSEPAWRRALADWTPPAA